MAPATTRPRRRAARLTGASGWRAIAGADPARSAYPPTEYAHAFWLDRANGRLAIQYWFYYPFNEWLNHHEGDWEHVQVILEGHACALEDATVVEAGSTPSGTNSSSTAGATSRRTCCACGRSRATASRPARPMTTTCWCSPAGAGNSSGGRARRAAAAIPCPRATPAPAAASVPSAPPTTRDARRASSLPSRFAWCCCPSRERLDTNAHPELSLAAAATFLRRCAARARVNPPLMDALGRGSAPLQPALRREWRRCRSASAVDRKPAARRHARLPAPRLEADRPECGWKSTRPSLAFVRIPGLESGGGNQSSNPRLPDRRLPRVTIAMSTPDSGTNSNCDARAGAAPASAPPPARSPARSPPAPARLLAGRAGRG